MIRNELWIVTTLISVGVIGGLYYNWPAPYVESNRLEKVTPDPAINHESLTGNLNATTKPVAPPITPVELSQRIQDGDDYLLVGNFQFAIQYYAPVYELFPHDISLLLRLGLAYEKNAQPAFAIQYYRKAETEQQSSQNHRLAAALGIIRCQRILGNGNDSLRWLSEYFLKFADSKNIRSELKFELGYELARHWRNATMENVRNELSDLDTLAFEPCQIKTDTLLALFSLPRSVASETAEPSTGFRSLSLIQRPSDDIALMVVSAHTPTLSISDLLNQLSAETGLSIPLPDEIKPYMVGRTAKLDSSAMPAAILLDCVLSPLKLAWLQHNDQITITPLSSFTASKASRFLGNQAMRMGRYLSLNFSSVDCIPALDLDRANIHFLLQQYDEASVTLKQLENEQLTGELNAKIHLTMGLLENRFDRAENSIPLLTTVVDQSSDEQLQAAAYANIGKIHLDNFEIEPAIISSSRSLALTDDPNVRAVAALNLARAYMYSDDPASANRILFENSTAFETRKQDQAIAFVIGAYARSLATSSPIRRRKAVESTLLALAGIDSQQWTFGSIDRILLARAFRKTGLVDKAISFLQSDTQETSSQSTSVWNRLLKSELASMLKAENQLEVAADLYAELAAEMSDSIGKEAKLNLAILALEEKQDPQECIRLCRELWEFELSNAMKESTLKTMGHAYNAQGKSTLSSYCFLGMLPDGDQ